MSLRALHMLFAAMAVAALAAAGAANAGKGGPSPGVMLGGKGVAAVDGSVRYVAHHRAGLTTVTAHAGEGTVVRRGAVTGLVGVPRVAFDGSTGGLTHDGRTLVLASPGAVGGKSRFAVLSTRTLRLQRMIELRGTWSYDAVSPRGEKLYLVEHTLSESPTYRVRAYDLRRGRLLREAVIDPRQGGRAMTGAPVTRALGPGGIWAYTLYQKPGGLPFVHALDTMRGKALCIELPWRGNQGRLFDVRMRVEGRQLVLTKLGGAQLATIDTRAFAVHPHKNPLRTTAR